MNINIDPVNEQQKNISDAELSKYVSANDHTIVLSQSAIILLIK